jgi:hypothetical protein
VSYEAAQSLLRLISNARPTFFSGILEAAVHVVTSLQRAIVKFLTKSLPSPLAAKFEVTDIQGHREQSRSSASNHLQRRNFGD